MAHPDGEPGILSSDSDVGPMTNDSEGTANHPGCWQIPITVEGVKTIVLIDMGVLVTMMGAHCIKKCNGRMH